MAGVDVPQLLEMSPDELDELFRKQPAGEIPGGEAEGTVLVAPGTEIAGPAEEVRSSSSSGRARSSTPTRASSAT